MENLLSASIFLLFELFSILICSATIGILIYLFSLPFKCAKNFRDGCKLFIFERLFLIITIAMVLTTTRFLLTRF